MELDRRTYGRRRGGANHISDRVPQGGDKGVPSGRVPRKGQDVDCNEVTFLAHTCTGRHDHIGGGKPPSPKVPKMQHAGPVAVPKREAQEYSDVQEWGGEDEAATGGDGNTGKHRDGL